MALRRKWMWIYVGATAAALALVQLAPVLGSLFMPIEVVPEASIQLIVPGSLLKVVALLAVFAVSSALVGGLARRTIRSEIALGTIVLAVVQWGLWIARTKGAIGTLLTSPIAFVSEGGGMILPPLIGLLL